MGSLPEATTSAAIEEYITEMKERLKNCDYGKIGLIFSVHENQVVYIREIREQGYRVIDES